MCMTDVDIGSLVHELDVTLWVGKDGIDPAIDELDSQLEDRDAVKVKFQRAASAGEDVEDLAAELADAASGTVGDVRGNTAIIYR